MHLMKEEGGSKLRAIFNSDLGLVIGHRKKSVAYEFIKNPEEIEYLYLERYLTGALRGPPCSSRVNSFAS